MRLKKKIHIMDQVQCNLWNVISYKIFCVEKRSIYTLPIFWCTDDEMKVTDTVKDSLGYFEMF